MDLIQKLTTAYHVYYRMYKSLTSAKGFGYNLRLTWREMNINYKARKTHPVRHISLGYDCMMRTILTKWLLEPDRSCGQRSMVFDRTKHTSKMIADLLEKDFAGYFDNWRFNPAPALKCWFNLLQASPDLKLPESWLEAREGDDYLFYFHDRDCGPEDMEKIKKRTRRRLNLFLETLTAPKETDLYILHKRLSENPADIERMCRLIREKRGNVPTHILVFITDYRDPVEKIEGAVVKRCIYPYKDSSWGEHKVHKRLHVFFTMKIVRACRKYILENIPAAK